MSVLALRAPTACDVDRAVQFALETASEPALRRRLLGLLAPAGTDLASLSAATAEAAADEAIASLWDRLETDLAVRRAAAPKPRRRPRQAKG